MQLLEELTQALADTGTLTLPQRRRLWEAMGPLEPRERDAGTPRSLTGPLKKRAELALACAKKVSRIWAAFDGEDKRPQRLIRQTRAYLDGKITAEALSAESGVIEDFMSIVDEEGDSAAAAAIAAWKALVTALEDEALLEPWCAGCTGRDIDSYDWDAAKNAVMAWRDAGTGGDKGKRAVREMRFWAWYLETAAALLGAADYRFPPKFIKAFAEKQDPPRPVPAEVTLESFAAYLGGRYYYHTYTPARENRGQKGTYTLRIWYDGDSGICRKCGKSVTQFDMVWRDCCLWDIPLPGGDELEVLRVMQNFRCPNHPDELWCMPASTDLVSNYQEAFKHYVKGRKQLLAEQLKERLPLSLQVTGTGAVCNGYGIDARSFERCKDAAGLVNAAWVDKSAERYAFDVGHYLPHLYIQNSTFEDFLRRCPQQVRWLEDGSVELAVHRVWARFWLDGAGKPTRLMLTTRFFIWMKEKPLRQAALPGLLMEHCHLTQDEALEAVRTAQNRSGDYELAPLAGLTKGEAVRLQAALEAGGAACRILPSPAEDA